MTDNEKLIEEARGNSPLHGARSLIRRLADALEAAGKARTPTDDEREALNAEARAESERELPPLIVNGIDTMASGRVGYACGYVAGALRRSEVPESSAEDQGPAASCHLCVGAGGHEGYDGEWIECSCQRAEPQGEPSDADLDAARAEIAARMNYKVEPTRDAMRAALRAAGVVGQEGESRG